MSSIAAFLEGKSLEGEIREIEFPRFKDKDGKPAIIKIKNINAIENERILKMSRVIRKMKGKEELVLDNELYLDNLITNMIIEPNFADPDLLNKLKVSTPAIAIKSLLSAGEYIKLTTEITKMLGIDTDLGDIAKN